jgi:hypothetical protein
MEENQKDQAGKLGENGHEIENDSIVPDEVLERIPQKERKEFIQSITKVAGVFSPQNPLIKKITPEHISTFLQNADTFDKRDRDERQDERNYNFKIMVTVLFTSVLVCGLFIWTAQADLLKFFIGAIFGFGGGFGVGKFYKKQ